MEKNTIYKALADLGNESIVLEKTGFNKFTNSHYSTIDDICKVTRKPLSKHGLSIVQTLEYKEGVQYLNTYLYHVSGEKIESSFPIPAAKNMQDLGTSITYGKRYSIIAMLNIGSSDDDDDGNASVIAEAELIEKEKKDKAAFKAAKKVIKAQPKLLDASQIQTLTELLDGHDDMRACILKHYQTKYLTPVLKLKDIRQEDYIQLHSQVKGRVTNQTVAV